MKILYIGIHFHPELTGVSKYSSETAAYLATAGHEVHIVTAFPSYPYWKIFKEYKPKSKWFYQENWEGITIIRSPLWVPSKPSGLKRLRIDHME